ncbi:hypothetical protein FisN_1Hh566 [Fistulifera solaris]|uniref:F-box domain-containing protein n=1 Tax=Fistulifera solaris TaxID=1519565 RepID=A0A1Z5KQQ1_FISSO|nr:hypothetical protein FisN_1Hh566 [Fistulifera solaris]|eukprot:GAX28643.1 hypothetical protein FisN_1Hh566 [Fistulifera solaris]
MESAPPPGWFSRLRSEGQSSSVDAENTASSCSLPRFPFLELTEELQHHVLSFIADAPFESLGNDDASATLTDVLPLVSKHFQKISRSNLLWKAAFYRAIESDNVWKRAARSRSLPIPSRSGNDDVDFRSLYRRLYHEEIAFTGPVFIMGMEDEDIPVRYSLYLFEPRYRLMVERLLNIHEEWQRKANANEDSGSCPPLHFLHAHRGLGRQGGQPCVALLVEIIRCMGMPTGHYDVTLQVDAIVRLERFWVEPNTGHLYHAYGRKIQSM